MIITTKDSAVNLMMLVVRVMRLMEADVYPTYVPTPMRLPVLHRNGSVVLRM